MVWVQCGWTEKEGQQLHTNYSFLNQVTLVKERETGWFDVVHFLPRNQLRGFVPGKNLTVTWELRKASDHWMGGLIGEIHFIVLRSSHKDKFITWHSPSQGNYYSNYCLHFVNLYFGNRSLTKQPSDCSGLYHSLQINGQRNQQRNSEGKCWSERVRVHPCLQMHCCQCQELCELSPLHLWVSANQIPFYSILSRKAARNSWAKQRIFL